MTSAEHRDQRGGQSARRRGAALERAILQAAAEELRKSGYAGMTVDKVARRAATNKNTIYRRWPHRAALGVAAYGYLAEAQMPAPDTGTLRGDALEMLRQRTPPGPRPKAQSYGTCSALFARIRSFSACCANRPAEAP